MFFQSMSISQRILAIDLFQNWENEADFSPTSQETYAMKRPLQLPE